MFALPVAKVRSISLMVMVACLLGTAPKGSADDLDTDGDGIPDQAEEKNRDTDLDGVDNVLDPDDDGDSLPPALESWDPNGDGDPKDARDSDGDKTPDYLDADDDGDGVPTLQEVGPKGPTHPQNSDGDSFGAPSFAKRPDYLDPDDDNDGIATLDEDPNNDKLPQDDDTDDDEIPNYLDPDDDGDRVLSRDEVDVSQNIRSPRGLDTDQDKLPNYLDPDDDGDAVLTIAESHDGNRAPEDDDTDADNLPDYLDADDDGDSLPTGVELGALGAANPRDTDGDETFDYLDRDDDNDRKLTSKERSVRKRPDVDHDKVLDYLDADADGSTAPPLPGPNVDSDHDSIPNRLEDLNGLEGYEDDDGDSDSLENYLDPDDDGDGVPSNFEFDSPEAPRDFDLDGIADHLDADDDDDGVPTSEEAADPDGDNDPSDARRSFDPDAAPDYLNPDDDLDGITTRLERPGLKSVDHDGDGLPDFRDHDDDNDGYYKEGTGDLDGDGIPAYLDPDEHPETSDDRDGDGVLDATEYGPGGPQSPRDTDGDGLSDFIDADDDGDGILTAMEGGPDVDLDDDQHPDYLDTDDDGDGILTQVEAKSGIDSDGDGIANYRDTDADGDGILDAEEAGDGDGDGVADYLEPRDRNEPSAAEEDAGTSEEPDSGADRPRASAAGGDEYAAGDGAASCSVHRGAPSSALYWGVMLGFIMTIGSRRLRGRRRSLSSDQPWLGCLILVSFYAGCSGTSAGYDEEVMNGQRGHSSDAGAEVSALDAAVEGAAPSCKIDPVGLELDVPDQNDLESWALVGWKNQIGLARRVSGCETGTSQATTFIEAWSFASTGEISMPTRRELGVSRCNASRTIALTQGRDNAALFLSSTHDGPDELYGTDLLGEGRPTRLTFDPGLSQESEKLLRAVAWNGQTMLAFANHQEGMGDQLVTRLGEVETEIVPFGTSISDLALAAFTDSPGLGGIIAWVSQGAKGSEIRAQRLDPVGKPLGTSTVITAKVFAASRVRFEMLTSKTEAMPVGALVYLISDDQKRGELRFRTVSVSGEIGQEQGVMTAGLDIRSFALAPFASGYALFYRVAVGDKAVLHVRMIDLNGVTASYGQLLLTEASVVGSAPSAVATNDGRLTVAFTDVTREGTKLRVLRATCDPG